MAKDGIKNMFEGPVLPLLVKLALPMFVAQVVQIIYNLTDTFWVGRIDLSDPGIVGGVGLIIPIIFMAMAITQGLLTGSSALVARAIGSDDTKAISNVAESGLFIALMATILMTVPIYLFAPAIIRAMGAEGSYYDTGLTYLYWVLPTAGLAFATSILNGILQGEGLMKHVMISLLIGPIINLFLDPLLIFGFHLGIKGAAIATVVGQLLGLIYTVSVFIRKIPYVQPDWHIHKVSTKTMKSIISIGAPQFFSFMIMAVSVMLINRIIISLDPYAMTAMQLWQKVDHILFAPILALSAALVTVVGQNAGRGNILRIRTVFRVGVGLAASVFLVLATPVVIFAPWIYPLFTNVESVITYAVRQTRIVEFTAIVACSGMLARATFQALGAIVPAFFLTALRLLILIIPFILLYVYIFDLGVPGIWYGMITGNIITGFVSFFWMESYLGKLIRGEKQLRKI